MNFQLTFSVQFSQFNEAQVGQISVKSVEHLAVSRYLSPDLAVPDRLAPGVPWAVSSCRVTFICLTQRYVVTLEHCVTVWHGEPSFIAHCWLLSSAHCSSGWHEALSLLALCAPRAIVYKCEEEAMIFTCSNRIVVIMRKCCLRRIRWTISRPRVCGLLTAPGAVIDCSYWI